MSTEDIAGLNLVEPDLTSEDWDNYDPGVMTVPPPGQYTGRAPETFKFTASQAGYLMAEIDPITIIDAGKYEGYKIRFERASVKKYGNSPACRMGDYLRACGIATFPKGNEGWAEAVQLTAGTPLSIILDWQAYCKECATEVKSARDFPKSDAGEPIPEVPCTSCGQILRARPRVRRYVSAVG